MPFRSRIGLLGSTVCLLLATSCGAGTATGVDSDIVADGVVRYVGLEGGFFALVSSTNRRFDPINLPVEFAQDGLSVQFSGTVRYDLVSSHGYGERLEIRAITRR